MSLQFCTRCQAYVYRQKGQTTIWLCKAHEDAKREQSRRVNTPPQKPERLGRAATAKKVGM